MNPTISNSPVVPHENTSFTTTINVKVSDRTTVAVELQVAVQFDDPNLTKLPTGIYFHVRHPFVPTNGWQTALRLSDYPELRQKILEVIGVPASTRLYWLPNRGCSCGCSPAYYFAEVGRVSVAISDPEDGVADAARPFVAHQHKMLGRFAALYPAATIIVGDDEERYRIFGRAAALASSLLCRKLIRRIGGKIEAVELMPSEVTAAATTLAQSGHLVVVAGRAIGTSPTSYAVRLVLEPTSAGQREVRRG